MAKRFRNLIGPNLRKLRERMGLKQDDLAARLQLAGLDHFDRVTVAKVESQIRSLYDYEAIVFAKVLQVDVATLFEISPASLQKYLPYVIKGALD